MIIKRNILKLQRFNYTNSAQSNLKTKRNIIIESQNQQLPIPTELSSGLNSIVDYFPPIRYGFAYGSAVFPQASYSPKHTSMFDFIFAVSHPNHWHSVNLQRNPHHYSIPARLAGSSAISWLQEHGPGAEIWYNLQVKVDQKVIKYGVISIDGLCNDLIDWQTLYVSGRMHKPIHIIRDDPRVRLAQQVNLASALRTALLLLPEKFNEIQLYLTIAGLSYTGDFRMKFAENPNKIHNILDHQFTFFRFLYRPLLDALKSTIISPHLSTSHSNPIGTGTGTETFIQDSSPRARAELLNKIPLKLKERIKSKYEIKLNNNTYYSNQEQYSNSSSNELDILIKIVEDDSFNLNFKKSLVDIVYYPSLFQSLKGVFSAGPLKSLSYSAAKVMKRFSN